ncbi:hypothetical protein COT66_01280 [Candidatus Shapirobacteria bacterium CG09_land_8_20_14_0_10_49_15]|uniref:UDP-N-acetylmuramoyl-tripeptide--D-alanyl-D-alanine ligase n=2 Tax=Candidatus Shapironibacteriota TaxID=1752721 RepID=A0A2M8L6K4_9BACT|nr:MAG: hypothetical protein COT66_01280 [Candidatus Shapirobacteria bacterium CG09_land_8_20_14_0_10_49_15]PJE69818.1 MAG: hypothetical protein COU97_02995 [Candidatus Shapirobacteria bacterium CG10_big_fil_rev_8_21_14_0_10_48_15]
MPQTAWWKQPYHQTRRLAAHWWLQRHPQVTVIGVTGSYGKTNTVRAIQTVLAEKFKVLPTEINLDTNYNLPITLLRLRNHQKLVLEYGVDHAGEMATHLQLVTPSVAVVTGINPTHAEPELLGSLQGIIKEKSQLFARAGLTILNKDDPDVQQMKPAGKVWWYSTQGQADFWADQIRVNLQGTSFRLHCRSTSEEAFGHHPRRNFHTGLVGRHFVQACLAAAAVGVHEGVGWPQIKAGLAKLTPLRGRLSLEPGPRGSTWLNDALRANPASTLAGLQTLADLPTKNKRLAVLGEMGELGDQAEKEHRRVGRAVARLKIDYLIGVGPLQKLAVAASQMPKDKAFAVSNVQEAAAALKKILRQGDLVYLKGSLLRHMERVLLILQGQPVGCPKVVCDHYDQCPTCAEL